MKIILLRHAQSTSNQANRADSQIDSELSPQGKKDAETLVSKLSMFTIDLFVVSPLIRTKQTIQPLLNKYKHPAVIFSDLTLERNLGDWNGTPLGAFQKYCDEHHFNKITHRPKNGESIQDLYQRALQFLSFLKEHITKKTILVCGHKNFLLCLEIALTDKNIANYYVHTALEPTQFRILTI